MTHSDGDTLALCCRTIVTTPDLDRKIDVAYRTGKRWFGRTLSRFGSEGEKFPERPGRPAEPVLLPPSKMPKRSTGEVGRLALIHSLAHIELNAVDLTFDLVDRFARENLPRSFFDDWVQVGLEEAKHFGLLKKRLEELGTYYGGFPAHAGLWEAAQDTGQDLIARLAIIPLVLEARGLDVTPPMIEKMRNAGDERTAGILEIIYRDEKRHVAFGAKWFRFLCDRHRIAPEPAFHEAVRRCFRGPLKAPFNDRARSEAGLTPGFYKPLLALTGY